MFYISSEVIILPADVNENVCRVKMVAVVTYDKIAYPHLKTRASVSKHELPLLCWIKTYFILNAYLHCLPVMVGISISPSLANPGGDTRMGAVYAIVASGIVRSRVRLADENTGTCLLAVDLAREGNETVFLKQDEVKF